MRAKQIEIFKVLRTGPDTFLRFIEMLVMIIVVVIYHDILFEVLK